MESAKRTEQNSFAEKNNFLGENEIMKRPEKWQKLMELKVINMLFNKLNAGNYLLRSFVSGDLFTLQQLFHTSKIASLSLLYGKLSEELHFLTLPI